MSMFLSYSTVFLSHALAKKWYFRDPSAHCQILSVNTIEGGAVSLLLSFDNQPSGKADTLPLRSIITGHREKVSFCYFLYAGLGEREVGGWDH